MDPNHDTTGSPQTFQTAGQTLYFAYGSNLSFDQMAKRCPGSRFVGRARLHNYQFQINERGYANVVQTNVPDEVVEGLCYRLTESDEINLDHYEGVPVAYGKEELEAEFFPAAPDLIGRDVQDIISYRTPLDQFSVPLKEGLIASAVSREQRYGSTSEYQVGPAYRKQKVIEILKVVVPKRDDSLAETVPDMGAFGPGVVANVMVYLSRTFVTPGDPWDEYTERMELGIREASQLGVSISYLRDVVRLWLKVGRGSK
jgi:hypothetical protein